MGIGDSAIQITAVLLAVWGLLFAGEWFVAARLFAQAEPLGGLVRAAVGLPIVGSAGPKLFASPTAVRRYFACFGLFAVGLLVGSDPWLMLAACLAMLMMATLFVASCGNFWVGGSDKMAITVLMSLVLALLGHVIGSPPVRFAGELLAAGQLAICYCASGLFKIAAKRWRDGSELARVMRSDMYGNPAGAWLFGSKPVALAASWLLMLAEVLYPLALLAPRPILLAVLAGFLLFHVATAVFMRLNAFPWAFAAAYPFTLAFSEHLRAAF